MKHWTAEEKTKIVQEALTPGNTFHSVAPKYGLSPMTIYQWHHEIEGYIHLLQAASGTLSQALNEDEELVWVGVPDLMSQRGNWAIAILIAMVVLPALLVISVQTHNTGLARAVPVLALIMVVICWLANRIYFSSIDVDYAVTDKRIFNIKRKPDYSTFFYRRTGPQTTGNEIVFANSYAFTQLQSIQLEENKDDVGNLILIGKDGKVITTFCGISHVRAMWESLPANLKSLS